MKIKLSTRNVYGDNVLQAACDRSEALFQLIKNRSHLKAIELPLLAKMGFEIEIVGELRALSSEMTEHEVPHNKIGAQLFIKNKD